MILQCTRRRCMSVNGVHVDLKEGLGEMYLVCL